MKTTFVTDVKTGTISIPKDTELTYVALLTKGWQDEKTLNFDFEGENSTLKFIAFIIGKDHNKFQFKTNANHYANSTNSTYIVRTVMYDNSEINYIGSLNIKPDTRHISTHLTHHTLLLSKTAKATTTPSLEIQAADVKASHAASIGHVDENQLFYLTTRGLDPKTAKDLMIQGFLKSDLQKIKDKKIREQVTKKLNFGIA